MIGHRRAVKTCRGKYFDIPFFRYSARRVEARRHYADDLIQVGVHPHVFAEDVWIASKHAFPEPVADDDFRNYAWGVVLRIEGATQLRLHAQQREIIRRADE